MTESDWWQKDKNDEVATKAKLWRPLSRAIGGFDLDPAAGCEPTPIADERYTKEDDGLLQPWFGTVWLNPPFSEKNQWYKRLVDQYWNGEVDRAVALGTVDTSTDWFHDWFATADYLCLLNGRDWYVAEGDSPSFQTQIGVWNPTDAVIQTLQRFGTVVKPESSNNQSKL